MRTVRTSDRNIDISVIVGKLYDKLSVHYADIETDRHEQHSLNVLIVRLIFLLYAEDTGLLHSRQAFCEYLKTVPAPLMRSALSELFAVLDTPEEKRDACTDPMLSRFPYIGSGLFADNTITIPQFTEELQTELIEQALCGFDWSGISPTIFGAVFESTLNPETRRSGGMHYTSKENIHKVIDPLFLDDLKDELAEIEAITTVKTRNLSLIQFKRKLASLVFLDPACGSGNFLTETYLCLRELENRVIQDYFGYSALLFSNTEDADTIQVTLDQFYGIEINDFAVDVAKTALWIAEQQMMEETQMLLPDYNFQFLPLKSNSNIRLGNAVTLDWDEVVPSERCSYIIGNPPFVGASMMTKEQKSEAVAVFGDIQLSNSIDYVGTWYHKAAEYMQDTEIRTAFVSTNSITQGEQVAPLWSKILDKYKGRIIFAYRTFVWDSEASNKAQVYCVVIGFTCSKYTKPLIIFDKDEKGELQRHVASSISPYLIDAPAILITSRPRPLCGVPRIILGNKPADGGHLLLKTEKDAQEFISDPDLAKYVREYICSKDYVNGKKRYCLWLVGAKLEELLSNEKLARRLQAVSEARGKSTAKPTRDKARQPHLFFFISQPKTDYLIVPSATSKNRSYIPIGFVPSDVIASNATAMIADANLYLFGVLTSRMHMAWLRAFGGRLKGDYRYSNNIVYNNFPWPNPTDTQRQQIERAAEQVLQARAMHPGRSLVQMYDGISPLPAKHSKSDKKKYDLLEYADLKLAHENLDKAVEEAYRIKSDASYDERIAHLLQLYQALIKPKTAKRKHKD